MQKNKQTNRGQNKREIKYHSHSYQNIIISIEREREREREKKKKNLDPWCRRGVWTGWTTTWCHALCNADYMDTIFFFFSLVALGEGGCPSPRACWAYPNMALMRLMNKSWIHIFMLYIYIYIYIYMSHSIIFILFLWVWYLLN